MQASEASCPKCQRSLARSGEVEFAGRTYPIFQCDDCTLVVPMFGEPTEVALTFAVDPASGRSFDPASADGPENSPPRWWESHF